jgi:hypothetical protein
MALTTRSIQGTWRLDKCGSRHQGANYSTSSYQRFSKHYTVPTAYVFGSYEPTAEARPPVPSLQQMSISEGALR